MIAVKNLHFVEFYKSYGLFFTLDAASVKHNQRVKGTFYHSQFIPRNTLLGSEGKKENIICDRIVSLPYFPLNHFLVRERM